MRRNLGDRLPVGQDERHAIVQKDPGMETTGTDGATTAADETLCYENEGPAVRTRHRSWEEVPFDLHGGTVTVL